LRWPLSSIGDEQRIGPFACKLRTLPPAMHMPRSTVLAQMTNARRTPATPPITIGMAASPPGGKICLVPPISIPKSRSTEGVDRDVQRPI
jgi:hypothetical protein